MANDGPAKAGERDLASLLRNLRPHLDARRFTFAIATELALGPDDFAIIREEEGPAAIRVDPDGEWARISLEVHSSLEAVGLTAALSGILAEAGISANVVASLRHDHLFVPWARRDEALNRLKSLAKATPLS